MKNLLSLLKQDIKFQLRQGFYFVYGIITVIYIILLKILGEWSSILSPIILFSDPTFIGFFFIGALLFFEREQRISEALFVTPVTIESYILSKCLSLTLITLLVVILITSIIHGLSVNWILLIPGISITSIIFILAGMLLSRIFRKITIYLVLGGLIMGPFSSPIVYILGLSDSRLFYLFPTTATLKLIYGAINGGISTFDTVYSLTYLTVVLIIMFLIVRKSEGGRNENN